MLISKRTILFFLILGQLGATFAAKKEESSSILTPAQMQSALYLDAMSIPCPGEIFAAINKVSRPNWTTLDRGGTAPVTTHRAQLALAVGVFVTNGYIAVEAQDGQQVKNIGRDMMSLSKALGVSQTILSRGNNLIEFADHNEWDSLRNELEATENEVKNTMVDQQDRNLITLTSAGAWLRGLEVASEIIVNHYSERGAALLNEPDLARHLASDLASLPEKLRNDPLVLNVKETLLHVATLLEKEHHGLTKADLSYIQAEAKKIVVDIGASDTSPLSPAPAHRTYQFTETEQNGK
ncbi:MAG: hypothetical protein ACOYK6_06625 [Chthoniobacterales bacterium]